MIDYYHNMSHPVPNMVYEMLQFSRFFRITATNISKNHPWYRMGYIVNNLLGIRNVAQIVLLMVQCIIQIKKSFNFLKIIQLTILFNFDIK